MSAPVWFVRSCGILTLGGGFTGAVILAAQVLGGQIQGFFVLIALAFTAAYLWGVFAGLMLIERDERAILWAAAFWVLQVPALSSAWLTFEFFAGARISVYLSGGGVQFNAMVGAVFNFFLLPQQPFVFGVNVLALLVVLMLGKYYRAA